MSRKIHGKIWIALLAAAVLSGCLSTTEMGKGGSMVTGAAGEKQAAVTGGGSSTGAGSQAKGASRKLQKCGKPIATVALSEDEGNKRAYTVHLSQLQLPQSPIPLLRLMFQQSNCFQIVDRGKGLTAIGTEQKLARQGLLKKGSNITGGQLVAADYTITPNIVFSEGNAGGAGIGMAAGALLGSVLPGAGLIAGGLRVSSKQAQVVLFLTDNRSGVQVASAEGSAESTDVGFGGMGLGGIAVGGGAWGNTNQGKVVAAAFMDATNKIIDLIRAR